MESWLDATQFLAEIDAVNASHPHQSLCAVTGPNSTRLVRAALASDSEWRDWHDVLARMPATNQVPSSSASVVDESPA